MNGAGMDYDPRTTTAVNYAGRPEHPTAKDSDPFGNGMDQINAANGIIENLLNERAKMREQIGVLSQNVASLTDRLRKFQDS